MIHQGSHERNHFLLVSVPAQGHINPALQLADRLIATGAQVTFVTTVFGQRHMVKEVSIYSESLNFSPFSDGYDDGNRPEGNLKHYRSEFRRRGTDFLLSLVGTSADVGRPITCFVYTMLLPWVSEVAEGLQLPSALLWVQPATVFDIFYYYFNGYRNLILEDMNDPSHTVNLPCLPILKSQDLPSLFNASDPYAFVIELFQEQFESLSQETKSFTVLVNTFDELELEQMKAIDKLILVGIGPLVPYRANMLDHSKEYIHWLDSKDESSVVYVSVGSFAVLANKQMEELARGLVDSERPFLWVIRSGEHGSKAQVKDNDEDEKYREILKEEHKGMIVPWCSQVEVLNHPSVGCFVSHCGWNSTLETIGAGVPVVAAFPTMADQGTNAKLIEDVWKIGVRVRPNEEDKIVSSEELVTCLKEVMEGEKGEELRQNAHKWRDLSREAMKEGGSSNRNLGAFAEAVRKSSSI